MCFAFRFSRNKFYWCGYMIFIFMTVGESVILIFSVLKVFLFSYFFFSTLIKRFCEFGVKREWKRSMVFEICVQKWIMAGVFLSPIFFLLFLFIVLLGRINGCVCIPSCRCRFSISYWKGKFFFPNKKPPSGREIVFRESFHFVKMRKTFRDVSY